MNSKSSEEAVGGVTISFHDVPAMGAAKGRGFSPMDGTSVASNSLMAVRRCSGGWKGALGSGCQDCLWKWCARDCITLWWPTSCL